MLDRPASPSVGAARTTRRSASPRTSRSDSTAGICCCSPTTTARSPSWRRRRPRPYMADDVREALDGAGGAAATSRSASSAAAGWSTSPSASGPAAEFVAGLHGLEITGPDAAFHHYALDSVAPVIERLVREAERELAWCPGLLARGQDLRAHLSRPAGAAGAGRAARSRSSKRSPSRMLEARVLKLLIGDRRPLELLPAVDWHKGRAVAMDPRARRARASIGPCSSSTSATTAPTRTRSPALADDDIAIGVGDRPHTHLIDCRLERARGGRPVLPRAPWRTAA